MGQWLENLLGTAKVVVKGEYPERVINSALARGMSLKGVIKGGEGLVLQLRAADLNRLKGLGEITGHEIEVVEVMGLPHYRRWVSRRFMFLAGLFLFVVLLYLLSSFVWFVEVLGTKTIEPRKLLATAAEHGLYPGAFKGNFSRDEVEKVIMERYPELAYVEIESRGVWVGIKVVEKILPNPVVVGPCHLVAAKGGIVEEILVLEGQPLVEPGDTVGMGDVLISGVVYLTTEGTEKEDPGERKPLLVHARGIVKARVCYEGYGEQPFNEEKANMTLVRCRWKMVFPLGEVVIKDQGIKQETGMEKRETRERLWNTPWGKIGWLEEKWFVATTKAKSYEDREALILAKEEAMKDLKRKLGKAEKIINTKTVVVSFPSDTVMRVKVVAEVLEDIGREQPINLEENMP